VFSSFLPKIRNRFKIVGMNIRNIGMGTFVTVINENPIPDSYKIDPLAPKKAESIMKLQEKIVAMENDSKFIKVTEDATPLWKFNHRSRLNIV
jgi:hypothetical protein